MGADAGFCNGKDSESWLKSLDGHTPLAGWEWVGGKGAPLMLWLRQCPPPDAGAGCASQRGGAGAGGGFFYLFLHFCFITTGRAGAVVSRAIGPPVGSLHAAQAILLPGSSAVCIVTSGREGRGSRGRGAFGGVLPDRGVQLALVGWAARRGPIISIQRGH